MRRTPERRARASNGFGHRPVRDPLAVREAAAAHHAGRPAHRSEEFLHQPRLALARGPQHGEQQAAPVLGGAGERAREVLELAVSADHRGQERAAGLPGLRDDPEQTVGGDGLGLPLERERFDGFRLDRVADEAIRLVADQDLARVGGGLEPGGRVHGVAGDAAEVGRIGTHEDLAGVHADPAGEPDAVVALELVVEVLERRAHVDGGADRSERVVLVELRDAEHGHHGVADELLDRAAVALERGAHRVEVAGHDLAHGLGVELLAELGRAGHVAEHDRDGLADLGSLGRVGRAELGAADRAEVRALGVPRPAVRTGRHGPESRPRTYGTNRSSWRAERISKG